MKKIIIILTSALCLLLWPAFGLRAQDSGEYLPEEGDWAISVSAVPMLTYVGQFFNGTAGNALNEFAAQPYLNNDVNTGAFAQLTPLASVVVRYMISDEKALRINAGWLFSNDVNNFYSRDDAAVTENPLSQAKVIDTRKDRRNGFSLMAGLERRVGKRRIQGVFGGGILLAAQTRSSVYSYGNAITQYNQTPTSSNGGAMAVPANLAAAYASMRYLDVHNANRDHYAGLVGFAGIEWFFTPKISIGGEVNVAAVYSSRAIQSYTAEGFNSLTGEVDTWTQLTAPGSRGFDFGTGNVGANISLSFYF